METTPAAPLTASILCHILTDIYTASAFPVILCIGTDRIIGDSLGPMTGSILAYKTDTCQTDCPISVYGTLSAPVHALNLNETLLKIKKKHPYCPVIAVDASLGSFHHIGTVFVRTGCIQPGAGVHKQLPAAGDISITGITAADSTHPYLSLQTARLSVITEMADYISQCILEACASITEKFVPPAHEAMLPHQYTPDHRQQAHHWQSGLP